MVKKILHLTDHLPEYHTPWGGAEKVAFRHISVLLDDKNLKTYVGTVKSLKKVEENFIHLRVWTLEDLFPRKLHIYITGIKNQLVPFDPLAFVSVLIAVLRIRPDVIHIHKANKISFAPIVAGRILNIPVVLAIYDYWYFCPGAMLIDADAHPCHKFHGKWCYSCSATRKFGIAAKISSLYRRQLFDWFYKKVEGFLVLSDSNVKLLVEYGIPKSKIFVVRQLFNPVKIKANSKIQKGSIYMNAWMAPHKGVHVVIAAFAEVLKKVHNAKLTLETKVLDPHYETRINKMIKQLKLKDKIEIFERKTVDDYLQKIGQANVVVVAEQWENMAPTTLSDALSQGKPVVASNIGGLPEMLKDGIGGLLADPYSPDDFANKIVKIIEDPKLTLKLSLNAPKLVEKLGSAKQVQIQLKHLYRKVLS